MEVALYLHAVDPVIRGVDGGEVHRALEPEPCQPFGRRRVMVGGLVRERCRGRGRGR